MTLSNLSPHRRFIGGSLLIVFLSVIVDIPAMAQGASSKDGHGSNIKWDLSESHIVITYDLTGPSDVTYDVAIAMKNEKDSTFNIVPAAVEGDVGGGVHAGKAHEIRWYFRNDYPQGFQGEGYYFEILVKPIEQKNNLVYYIVGGAALTVGIVALLLGSNSPDNAQQTFGLPGPPARP